MEVGLGQMRLTPDSFWGMTPRELYACQKGFFDHVTFLEHEAWKRTIAEINIHLPKNKKINPDRVLKKNKKVRLPTREETLRLIEKWR